MDVNPIIWREGVCDPHAHVFNNRVYVYASHDCPCGTDGFRMEDWQIWSSEDLVNWKLERTIYPEEFYCGKLDQCWAVDAAYKDGKYCWYFSTGDWGVGVGVSDHPAGPFTDALGGPLVDFSTEPIGISKWDPCVFQDDDGSAYLIVGDCRSEGYNAYMIGKLSDDMIHLAEPLRKVEYRGNICPEDKASIHKYNVRYYLTHSSSYAVSDNVYGPYEYMGNTGCNVDHGSYFTYRGQTYFASGGMDNPNRYYRASFIAPCHYRENGEIVVDQKIMEYGSGQYDAVWEKIAAVWYFEGPHDCKREREDGSFVVSLKKGESLSFPNISNAEENAVLSFCVAAPDPAVLYIRENDENGKLLGRCEIPGTGGSKIYREIRCRLVNRAGNLDLCITAQGDGEGELLRMESFRFESDRSRCAVQPVLCEAGRGAVIEPCPEASWGNVLKNLNLKNTYLEAAADGGSGGKGMLEVYYQAEGVSTELALYVNGVLKETVCFADTGRKIHKLEIPVCLKPGVNRIRLECQKYQNGYLAIDRLIAAREKETAKTYPAANGQVFPRGNGCWDGFPQRECDPQAYSGRTVKYLGVPGQGCVVDGIDGGAGGKAVLIFHYALAGEKNSPYRLRINGKEQEADLIFPGTGDGSLRCGADITAEAELMPGENNRIELKKTGDMDEGILIDGITVIPY